MDLGQELVECMVIAGSFSAVAQIKYASCNRFERSCVRPVVTDGVIICLRPPLWKNFVYHQVSFIGIKVMRFGYHTRCLDCLGRQIPKSHALRRVEKQGLETHY